jgi:hypothetical protein
MPRPDEYNHRPIRHTGSGAMTIPMSPIVVFRFARWENQNNLAAVHESLDGP